MPSGPKKRKAAKKKKNLRDVDLERPESKEGNNGGEVPPSILQDHSNKSGHLTEGEDLKNGVELKIYDPLPKAGLGTDESAEENLGKEDLGVFQVEIEDKTIRENGISEYEEISVNGGLTEEVVYLNDSVMEDLGILSNERDAKNEYESDKEKGRSELNEIVSAEEQPYDMKDPQSEEDLHPNDSVNGVVEETPTEWDLGNENMSNKVNGNLENEKLDSSKRGEDDPSSNMWNQEQEIIISHVDSVKIADASSVLQVEEDFSAMVQEPGDSVMKKSPLVVSEKTLSLSVNEEDNTSHPEDYDAEQHRDVGANEPLLNATPRTTSWKSCCGLFEVLKGSGY